MVLVAIDIYGRSIDNPDIKLVIQLDILPRFDGMIQRMSREEEKNRQALFILTA